MNKRISIGELTAQAGVSRRAVRFYVVRGLLDPPVSRGRGSGYTAAHVERLQAILRWQKQGLSLATITQIVAGELSEDAAMTEVETPSVGSVWRRINLTSGVELHIDESRHLSAEQLAAIRQILQ
jgi:DNA-binding transcriptional MerR regulator